jgi:hypothetical protein
MNAPDLFPESLPPADPLYGLAVTMPSHCRCGAFAAAVGESVGPHAAALRCARCGAHRGWLARAEHAFIAEIIREFGTPSTPIVIRRRGARRRRLRRG